MSFDEWIITAGAEARLKVALDRPGEPRVSGADSLLHVPLIAFALLVIAQHLRGGLRTAEISAWTAATLSERRAAARGSFSRYAWSVELRGRCSEALVFLEGADFVSVVGSAGERLVQLTERGSDFLAFARHKPGGAGLHAELSSACKAAEARGITLL